MAFLGKHFFAYTVYTVYTCILYIWLCLFLTRAVFSKGRKFDLCESYPRITPRTIPRITPPNHTPKNHDYECFFWDRLGLHWPHYSSFNWPDKLIDQCWPDPMIPGYLHIPSRSGESSPRAQSLIIIPKLAGSGWLAGWLGGWLSCCCWLGGWLRGWLLAVLPMRLMRGMTPAVAGWLAGNQTKNPYMRRTSRRDAGRPADINHRCAFRSSHSSYSDPVQGRLAGRVIAAIK